MTSFILLIVFGTFITGTLYNLFPLLTGVFTMQEYLQSIVNYCVGDTIGVIVFAPFLVKIVKYIEYKARPIKLFDPYHQYSPLHLIKEKLFLVNFAFLQFVVFLISYLYSLGIDVIYLLFIPLFVFTLQYNYTGAVIGSFLINTEIVFLLSTFNIPVNELLLLQFFMLILSTTGLLMGIVIKEKIEIRDELIELENMLEHGHTMENLGRVSSGIAHDFKNILFVISTQAELMSTLDEQIPELVQIRESIENSVDRANLLVSQITSLHAPIPSELELIDVNEEISLLLPLLPNLLGNVDCDYVNLTQQSLIMASKVIIQQILLNLVINARDAIGYTHSKTESGQITITLRPEIIDETNHIVLEIADNGPGIPDSLKQKIFQPYFTQKENGSGLGLSIVEGHVNLLHGQITVKDNQPQGAKFVILFNPI